MRRKEAGRTVVVAERVSCEGQSQHSWDPKRAILSGDCTSVSFWKVSKFELNLPQWH